MTNSKQTWELRKALIKDFYELYVKEFSTNWKEERMVRDMEISVMRLDNLQKLISKAREEERERILEEIKYKFVGIWPMEKLMHGKLNGSYTAEEVVESIYRLLDLFSNQKK